MTPVFARLFRGLDERVAARPALRTAANKVFPAHWSFLLGELALVALGVLVATGLFLTMFYRAGTEPVLYDGSAPLYQGQTVPAAFDSILRLSHDVPGGLLVRRLHRAAATLFVAAAVAHLLRVVLTGAFRRPREANHLVGVGLLVAAVVAGWTGHNLVWDVLAGTSLRIAYTLALSIPYAGPTIALWAFGGEFPSADLLPRLFIVHVLLVPGLLVGAVSVHLLMVVRQTHTQRPHGDGDGGRNVVGEPLWPLQFATSATMALGSVAVLVASAVLIPWSDVDLHGPYQVAQATNAAQPDWFLFWVEGALRLYPPVDIGIPGGALSGPFLVGVAFPLLWVGVVAVYPFLERRWRPEPGMHHVLQHPLDVPVRAGLVAAGLTLMAVLSLAAGNDVIARVLGAPTEVVVWVLRLLVLAGPPAVGVAVAAYARSQPPRWTDEAVDAEAPTR